MSLKGTIIETHGNNKAIIMNDKCEYIEIMIHGLVQPGDIIVYSERDICKKRPFFSYKAPAAVAAVFVFFLLSFFVYRQMLIGNVYAYVTLDINPSIEIQIVQDNTVIDVKGLNKDGTGLVSGLPSNTSLSPLLSDIIRLCYTGNYLKTPEPNYIGVSIYLPQPGNPQSLMDALDLSLRNKIESNNLTAHIFYLVVDEKTWQEARQKNVSPTNYLLWQHARMKGQNYTLGQDVSLQNPVLNAIAAQIAAKVSTTAAKENGAPSESPQSQNNTKPDQSDKIPAPPKAEPQQPGPPPNEPPAQEPPESLGNDNGSDNKPAPDDGAGSGSQPEAPPSDGGNGASSGSGNSERKK